VVVEFFYSKPSALDSWKKTNKGTTVLLKGSVTGIAANKMPFRGETLTTFVVTVRNVELVKELTTPESGKEKQVEQSAPQKRSRHRSSMTASAQELGAWVVITRTSSKLGILFWGKIQTESPRR
jgi:hypothetical protein